MCFNKEGVCRTERYNCVICDEGQYFEEMWHLLKIDCCEEGVYHPVCTVHLLKVWWAYHWEHIWCKLGPTIQRLLESCSIM